MGEDGFIELRSGRKLAYCVAGPKDGLPLFFFHGLAQSRLTTHPDLAIAEALGIRLVTVDRPGVGLSSPQRRRTLLQWPEDVSALADHLNFPQFAVFGHSAGAPYVAVCAHVLSDRVLSAAIVSGIPQPSLRLLKNVLESVFWKLGLLLFFVPSLARPIIWVGIRYWRPRAMALLERNMITLPDADRQVMADPAMRKMRVLSMLESFRQGSEGLYEDVLLLRRPWGFDLSAIEMPIRIWHGEDDSMVSISFGRELANSLGNSHREFRPNSGHNLLFGHWEEILQGIRDDAYKRMVISLYESLNQDRMMSSPTSRRPGVSAVVTTIARTFMPFIASIDIISLQPPPDPRRGFIIVANHRSLLDLIVGLIVFRRWRISPYIFVREDIFQIPIVGWLLGAVGGIPTGPENGVAAMRKGLHVLQQGGTLMIMPEGGIPKIYGPEDQFGRLKPGVARLASTSGNPVLIVGLANTDHAWPPGTVTPRFHLRRSRRPNIIMSAEWLPVTKGTSNSQILAAIDDGLRSILRRLDPP